MPSVVIYCVATLCTAMFGIINQGDAKTRHSPSFKRPDTAYRTAWHHGGIMVRHELALIVGSSTGFCLRRPVVSTSITTTMQQNRVTPIDSLYPEIFFKIFSFLLDIPEDPEKFRLPTIPECIIVSSVSRRWREIAYACSDLWSIIPTQNPIWTERALKHSKNRPLYMHLLALQYLSRANYVIIGARRHISLAECGILTEEEADALMGHSRPLLESLTIYNTDLSSVHYETDDIPAKLLELLLKNVVISSLAPILRSSAIADLTLCDVGLRWDGLFHPEYAHDEVDHPLAKILSCIPTLRRLAISRVVSSLHGSRTAHQPIVSLPNLKYLAISDSYSRVSELLSWLDLPLGVKCHIDAYDRVMPHDLEEVTKPLRFLNEIYLRNKSNTFVNYFSGVRIDQPAYFIEAEMTSGAIFLPLRSVAGMSVGDSGPQYTYSVQREHWSKWFQREESDIFTLLNSLPLIEAFHIRRLEVWHPIPQFFGLTKEFWVTISSIWPNIEHIVARGHATKRLIDEMARHPTIFRHLNSLELANADLVVQHTNVAHMLSKRLSCQSSTLRVIIKECCVQEDWAREMDEKFGERFEWDKIVDGNVDSGYDRYYREMEGDWKRWPDDLMYIPQSIGKRRLGTFSLLSQAK
jgi:hypothetical protein